MRHTRKRRAKGGGGGEQQSLPVEFINREIIENQVFRETMKLRVSELERKMKIIVSHLKDLTPKESPEFVKLMTVGGTRKQKRFRKK